ncbi:hypothetical protein [Actimicrobium antarcticum]|uniref:Uncharacterized protein n=1 Tax=Actimicrobium antarcticum TaxID=1051899 RepID=A0ABP7SUJ8_9BURK
MTTIVRTGGPGSGQPINVEGGEIHPVGLPTPIANVSVSLLEAREAAASVHVTTRETQSAIAPLTTLLGLALTAGSPAWRGDPIPKMRALQKKLLERGMQVEGEERDHALAAISVVEKNIQLRLRLHQLHMSDLQLTGSGEGGKS